MQDIITKEGYRYGFDPSKCTQCEGKCCTGESGYVWLSQKEMYEISDFLGINIEDFKIKYLRKIGYKYSLKERFVNDNFECIFFDTKEKNCSIYEYRPLQCRTFPFWEYFKKHTDEAVKECPGIVL